jgi:RimJ/RimL family protein N-acetyltransferase
MGRIDTDGNQSELSWLIASEARGKGYGKSIVHVLYKLSAPIRMAKIKSTNVASIKIAKSVGLVLEREMDGILYFRG